MYPHRGPPSYSFHHMSAGSYECSCTNWWVLITVISAGFCRWLQLTESLSEAWTPPLLACWARILSLRFSQKVNLENQTNVWDAEDGKQVPRDGNPSDWIFPTLSYFLRMEHSPICTVQQIKLRRFRVLGHWALFPEVTCGSLHFCFAPSPVSMPLQAFGYL